MATAATPDDPIKSRATPQTERRFWFWLVITMMLIVLAGFSHGFYLRPWVDFPYPKPVLSPFVFLHGVVFSGWMVLLLAQVSLVGAGRRDVHRTLGVFGFALAVAMIPLMYLVAVGQVARGNNPPIATPLDWTVVPLSGLPAMVVILALGWRTARRSDFQAHKRLMIGFTMMMLEPATGRLPLGPPGLVTNALLGVLALLPFLALFWWDRRQMGRLHWASVTGAGLALAAWLFRSWFLFHPGEWAPVARMMPGVAG